MSEQSQLIDPQVLYRASEIQRRMGWGPKGFRAARLAGLKVRYLHRGCYALGRDVIDYVMSAGQEEPPTAGKRKEPNDAHQ